MKTIENWLHQLFSNKVTGYGMPLSRVDHYVAALDLQELCGGVITVTGTNGKGSVVRLLESIYLQAGYRVAATTSPHLLHFCERLTLNGIPISESLMLDAFERVARVQAGQPINACDFIYLAIFLCIKEFKPDVALIEAGVGGRLDLANLFASQAAVVTTIDRDHAELLGDSRAEVAFEKAHLARRGCPFICGDDNAPPTLYEVVQEKSAILYQLNQLERGFFYEEYADYWNWTGPQHTYKKLPKPQLKLQNAATALMTVECLQERWPVSESALCRGLITVKMPGRFEVIEKDAVRFILDVAHNPQACRWLAQQLKDQPHAGQTYIVFGMALGKELRDALEPLIELADAWFVGELTGRASYSGLRIAQELAALGVKNCYTGAKLAQALERAVERAKQGDRIVVCGSFLAVQAAQQFLGRVRSW